MSDGRTAKISIAVVTAVLIAALVLTLVSMQALPSWILPLLFPVIAYALTIVMSVINEYNACKTVRIGEIAKSNLLVLLSSLVASGILYLEDIPILKLFGSPESYDPVDALGIPYPRESEQYRVATLNENHLKLQFFSSIVKAALPVRMEPSVKDGFAHGYWHFWAVLLPFFFLLNVQSICPA